MSKYHCLIAGLPDIKLDDSKQVFSVHSFKEEVYKLLSRGDKKLMNLFFLKYDNQNVLSWLKNPLENDPSVLDDRGTISPELFMELIEAYKEGEKIKKNIIPSYMIDFLKTYIQENMEPEKEHEHEVNEEEEDNNNPLSLEDKLSVLYYAYAIKCGNNFFSAWFELNLNIKNILAAVTCRKHGLDTKQYIVGNNTVAENLRTSTARDFNLSDEIDYLPELLRISEETDLAAREKKIDVLKWEWLDDNTIFKVFDIESVFAYLLKIEMIERWTNLDKATGEASFRELIGAMKKDSNKMLNEFKKKNNKI